MAWDVSLSVLAYYDEYISPNILLNFRKLELFPVEVRSGGEESLTTTILLGPLGVLLV